MKITFIHPCVGKISGEKYLKAWQMEPLPIAQLAALTPKRFQLNFYDDRIEPINYEHDTDLVAISVETYTAKRAYQISEKFRKRKIPVIMGGFHAKLCTEEVEEHADSVVIGEAETIWDSVLNDLENSNLKKIYKSTETCTFKDVQPDRSIYKDKKYLPIILLEAGRGCRFRCEFCSIQKFYSGNHKYRNFETLINEIQQLKNENKLFFFVDDNITANVNKSIELFKALIPLKIKWVGQADITIANNEELLFLMKKSGCQGILIGFESLKTENLQKMKKKLLSSENEISTAVKKIHKFGIRIYATFLYGYENDTINDYQKIIEFCKLHKLFMVGFNHLTPFPGTELYTRLENSGKLIYDKWWLDDRYTYGQIPFKTHIPVEEIEKICRNARKDFYSITSILNRARNITNIKGRLMLFAYFLINWMLRNDATIRMKLPLGVKE